MLNNEGWAGVAWPDGQSPTAGVLGHLLPDALPILLSAVEGPAQVVLDLGATWGSEEDQWLGLTKVASVTERELLGIVLDKGRRPAERLSAVWCLRHTPVPQVETLEALFRLTEGDPDPGAENVGRFFCFALRFMAPRNVRAVTALLEHADSQVHTGAFRAVAMDVRTMDTELATALEAGRKDKSELVRFLAGFSLERIRNGAQAAIAFADIHGDAGDLRPVADTLIRIAFAE